ncbi:hypothetical protein Hanom_Chr10g00925811 [Helianthus anomalus]
MCLAHEGNLVILLINLTKKYLVDLSFYTSAHPLSLSSSHLLNPSSSISGLSHQKSLEKHHYRSESQGSGRV